MKKKGHRCAIRNGSLVPKTPMSPQLEAITHSSKNAERRMEQENARTLPVNSERGRGRKEKDREVTKGTISLMSRDYVRLKRGTEGGETERRRRRGAPPDCRAYGYKRRQESERRRVINLAVFHVSRRGRALLMETSFDLHPRRSSPRSAFAPLPRRRRRRCRHRPFSCSTLPAWFPSGDRDKRVACTPKYCAWWY